MIILRKVEKEYEAGAHALAGITLAIPDGQFVFLVVPNGAGKSTLLKLLTREEAATSGTVRCFGRDVATLTGSDLAEHRRALGAVFQDPRLVSSKTVRENILLPLQADGKDLPEAEQKADAALALAEIQELADSFPEKLSGGQQQKVAIARALVNEPSAILADEPTANLSPNATEDVMAVLERINHRGITIVLATHSYDIVDLMERRVVALDAGHVVSDAAPASYPEFLRKAA